MRQLNTRDGFKAFRIIKQIGIKRIYKELSEAGQNGTKDEEFFFLILDSAADPKVEVAFYDFLNDIVGEDVSVKGFTEMRDIFKQIAEENNIMVFFKQLGSMMRSSKG